MLDWLKHKELGEVYVAAELRKAAALERLAHCAEVFLQIDAISVARAAEAAAPAEGTVEYEVEDPAFYAELRAIGEHLAKVTGGTPSPEAVLREYDARHGTTEGIVVGEADSEA